jgi:hypothetical protein
MMPGEQGVQGSIDAALHGLVAAPTGSATVSFREVVETMLRLASPGVDADIGGYGEWLKENAWKPEHIPALGSVLLFVYENGMANSYMQGPRFRYYKDTQTILWSGTWTEGRFVRVTFMKEWLNGGYAKSGWESAATMEWDSGTGNQSRYLGKCLPARLCG